MSSNSPPPSAQSDAQQHASPSKPRRRRKEARSSELTAAALALFVEKGFAATRLDDVAARAGVSKGTLYLYFDSKEALFKAVVEESIIPTLSAAEEQVAAYQGPITELLRELLFGWWAMYDQRGLTGVVKLIHAEANNFPEVARYYHDTVIVRARSLVRSILECSIASGEFVAVDIESAVDVTFAPMLMLMIWRHSLPLHGREINPEAYLRTHYEFLLRALLVRPT